MFKDIIKKYPQLAFLETSEFQRFPEENKLYLKDLIEDSLFWIELERRPNASDGFKFLAAAYGLNNAQEDANSQELSGKEREKFLRPHQDLYTMFNPYSGNSQGQNEAL